MGAIPLLVTLKVTPVLRNVEPLAPVIVKGKLPIGVAPVVLMVSVVEPDVVTEVGLKVGVAPDGNPLTLNVTAPTKPFKGVTVTVYDVPPPGTTVCEGG